MSEKSRNDLENKLIEIENCSLRQGDCLEIMQQLESGTVDLIYLDPPFYTGKSQKAITRDGTREYRFEDRWCSIEEYKGFIFARLTQMYRLLKNTGSIFFHCDRKTSHHARLILDDIFGESNFRSEIIWTYRRWSSSSKGLLPAHQNIYFYSKSDDYRFNTINCEYSPSTNVDQILQRRVRDIRGKTIYQRDSEGSPVLGGPKQGVPLGDVWDIPYLNPKAKERVGYPTQKPISLLERIISISTAPGALVLDPFCGSGTTLVACMLTGRSGIGCDISQDAIQLSARRLAEPCKSKSDLLERGRESYRSAIVEIESLLEGLDFVPVHRNKGIDALVYSEILDAHVPVKLQRSGESLEDACNLLLEAGKRRCSPLSILIQSRPEKGAKILECTFPALRIIDLPAVEIQRIFESV